MKRTAYLIVIFIIFVRAMQTGMVKVGFFVLIVGISLILIVPHANRMLQAYEDFWERKSQRNKSEKK